MSDELEARLDALEAWQDAAVTKMKRLGKENDRLRDPVAELEELVDPDPGLLATRHILLTHGASPPTPAERYHLDTEPGGTHPRHGGRGGGLVPR